MTLPDLIAEFERDYPNWGWLIRSAKDAPHIGAPYFVNLTPPEWNVSPLPRQVVEEFPSVKAVGDTPEDAFFFALAFLEQR